VCGAAHSPIRPLRPHRMKCAARTSPRGGAWSARSPSRCLGGPSSRTRNGPETLAPAPAAGASAVPRCVIADHGARAAPPSRRESGSGRRAPSPPSVLRAYATHASAPPHPASVTEAAAGGASLRSASSLHGPCLCHLHNSRRHRFYLLTSARCCIW
jgi:hypothetical protein